MLGLPEEKSISPQKPDDPVAEECIWSLMGSKSAHFFPPKITRPNPDQLTFRPNILALGFAGILAAPAWGLLGLAIITKLGYIKTYGVSTIVGFFFFGCLISLILIYFYCYCQKPLNFCKKAGIFWRGRDSSEVALHNPNLETTPLGDIHAVQFLKGEIEDSGRKKADIFDLIGYRPAGSPAKNVRRVFYQILLVFHDGRRHFLYGYHHRRKPAKQAKLLAEFLNVPLWEWEKKLI